MIDPASERNSSDIKIVHSFTTKKITQKFHNTPKTKQLKKNSAYYERWKIATANHSEEKNSCSSTATLATSKESFAQKPSLDKTSTFTSREVYIPDCISNKTPSTRKDDKTLTEQEVTTPTSEKSQEKNSPTPKAATETTWKFAHARTVGDKHIQRKVPCQDACLAGISPRPFVLACDGKGSAPLSHHGSEKAVEEINKQIRSSHRMLQLMLDDPKTPTEVVEILEKSFEDQIYRTAAYSQFDLARENGNKTKDYEFTLILYLHGKIRSYFLHIGDGALLVEKNNQIEVLSKPMNGEFANETYFVQFGRDAKRNSGLINSQNITAAAAFSDGTADNTLHRKTHVPKPIYTDLWKKLRHESLDNNKVQEFLETPDWLAARVTDDRCLAMISLHEKASQDSPEKKSETGVIHSGLKNRFSNVRQKGIGQK